MNELEQNLLLSSGDYINQKNYWLSLMSDNYTKTTFFVDSSLQNNVKKKECLEFTIPKPIATSILKLCKNSELSLYIMLIAAFKILIYYYTGNKDILVGSPIYNKLKTDKTLNDLVVLRDEINSEVSFKDFLMNVRKTILDAYKNQDYPLYKIEELKIAEEFGYSELFDVICLLKNIHDDVLEDNSFNVFAFEHFNDNIQVKIRFNSASFIKRSMSQFWEDYIRLLGVIERDINVLIGDINFLSSSEENLLKSFNNTSVFIDKTRTLNEIFEKQVEKYPDHIAVVFEDEHITYRELNEKANNLAWNLRKLGVKQESIVAIMVKQSIHMIISIMGVLKAGGAYLPIDASYPKDLVEYMLSDSNTSILITMNELEPLIPFSGKKLIIDNSSIYKGSGSNLDVISHLNNAAYVIYTSGTTGKPKGVVVEQRNVLTYINAFYNEFNISERNTILVHASYSFDHFVEEVYPVLLKGGRLVIVKKNDVLDIDVFSNIIQKNKINIISVSPHVLYELNKLPKEKLDGVNLFLSGGDALKKEYISNLVKYGLVYNTYGPTEATVCATYYKCVDDNIDENVLIGKPISNYSIYILDQNLKQVPIGIPGEIFISGDGITRGYLNKINLTKEKYLTNPLTGERMYKTGDMGRWLSDGNTEFMGRNDNQVKIRGYRIEIQQIESTILRFSDVKEVCVIDRDDKYGVKYLCAYFTADRVVNIAALKQYLLEELPAYMVPAYFIQLEYMPMTLNGFKVEKSELPDPHEIPNLDMGLVKPENETQRRVLKIWMEVLGRSDTEIGINNNFFDLGGHSLNAMKVVSGINKEFKMNLPLSIIFDSTTIKELAEKISEVSEKKYSVIENQPFREYYPASTAQRRIYLAQQFDERGTSYNIPVALLIKGDLDKEKIAKVLQILADRHDSLRTSFEIVNDEIMQKINTNIELEIKYMKNNKKDINEIIEELIQPFNLSTAPLIRCYLIERKDEYLFFMDIHHIVTDGLSIDIIIQEFQKLYIDESLEPLKIQYKDFTIWQNNLINNNLIDKQKEYWKEQLKGELPEIKLPSDFSRNVNQKFNGEKIFSDIGIELSSKLKALVAEEGVTIYVAMLSVYSILLAKYTNNSDVIVGSPVVGRTHPDTFGIVGMFVNTLPLRNFPEENKTFQSFLREVKTNTSKSFENQDYPIDVIMDEINNSSNGRRSLYDTLFTLQNTNLKNVKIGNLDISVFPFQNKTAKMDLIWDVLEVEENILFSVEYCTDLFKKETIQKFIAHYKNILRSICENKEIKIGDIELLSEQNKEEMNNIIQELQLTTKIEFEF